MTIIFTMEDTQIIQRITINLIPEIIKLIALFMEIIIIEWIEMETEDFQKRKVLQFLKQQGKEVRDQIKLIQKLNMHNQLKVEEVKVWMLKLLETKTWNNLETRKTLSFNKTRDLSVQHHNSKMAQEFLKEISRIKVFNLLLNLESKVQLLNLQVAFQLKARFITIQKSVIDVDFTTCKQCSTSTWNGLDANPNNVANGFTYIAWRYLL